MPPKVSAAITEFHKWFTLVGIPAIISLQLSIIGKLESNTIKVGEHEIDIRYQKRDIAKLQNDVDYLFSDRKQRGAFKQTTEQPQ